MLAGGVTQPIQADEDGMAVIEHRSKGTADIIVNGSRCGKYSLPDDVTIEVG